MRLKSPAVYIDHWQAAELAAAILDLPEPDGDDTDEIEEQLVDALDIDLNTLARVAERLLPLCAADRSELTGDFRRGFVRDFCYIVKMSFTPQVTQTGNG